MQGAVFRRKKALGRINSIHTNWRTSLVKNFGNDQEHFDLDILSILSCRPELPLGERVEHELRLRELWREGDRQPLEAASLIYKAMDHKRIGID